DASFLEAVFVHQFVVLIDELGQLVLHLDLDVLLSLNVPFDRLVGAIQVDLHFVIGDVFLDFRQIEVDPPVKVCASCSINPGAVDGRLGVPQHLQGAVRIGLHQLGGGLLLFDQIVGKLLRQQNLLLRCT